MSLVATTGPIGLYSLVPFPITPVDDVLLDEIISLFEHARVFPVTGQAIHTQGANKRLSLDPPRFVEIIGPLAERPAVVEASCLLVVAELHSIIKKRLVKIQQGIIADAGCFTSVDQQPDILEVVAVGDSGIVAVQPRRPVALVLVGTGSQAFSHDCIALNLNQLNQALPSKRQPACPIEDRNLLEQMEMCIHQF